VVRPGGTLAVMDARRAIWSVVLAPKRFLEWVYQPDDPLGPSRGQAMTHLIANGHGLDTSRWMRLEAEERRYRATVLRATRVTPPPAGDAHDDPPGREPA
jgi:hypothetical protein